MRAGRKALPWGVLVVALLTSTHQAFGLVDLQLRPPSQTVRVGNPVNIGLYAVSDNAGNQPVGQIRAIISWNPAFIEFTGINNNGPYSWLSSGLPNDSGQDGLNNDLNDGNLLYECLGQLGNPALATPSGLLVATLQFTGVGTAPSSPVSLVSQIGSTVTQVFDNVPPTGMNVTGSLTSNAVQIICLDPADCNDGNPCTDDACVSQQCQNIPNDANNPNDGLFCNGVENFCQGGEIVYLIPPPDCDDGLTCTTDSCNEAMDLCANTINAGQCLVTGVCYPIASLNPLNDCEACNPFVNQTGWSLRPPGGACGNQNATDCDNADTCDGAGNCLSNPVTDGTLCSTDGNDCSDDVCNSAVCTHPPKLMGATCGDPADTVCTEPDLCDGAGTCLGNHATNGTACDDALFCTPASSCSDGQCQGIGSICGNLICDEVTDTCKAVDLAWNPIQQVAIEGDIITVDLLAVSGTGSNMPFRALAIALLWDSTKLELLGHIDTGPYAWLTSGFPNDCGLDGLNEPCSGLPANDGTAYFEAVGQFSPSPPAIATVGGLLVTTYQFQALQEGMTGVDIALTFGLFTLSQVLDAETPGLNILRNIADPAEVNILECSSNPQCNDGLFCTGVETCVANDCAAGTDPCGTQFCNESSDSCVNCLTNDHCSDGLYCTGFESCQMGDCTPGNIPCPGQACDETNQVCVECLTDPDCDDGHACTIDLCVSNQCTHEPVDPFCDDGLFCTGQETCSLTLGCITEGNPCPDPMTCDEITDTCGGCQVPTALAEGSRYLAVTPPAGPDPVALFVAGSPTDNQVSCVALYVQSDGTLAAQPVFQSPAAWGTVHVHAAEIRPSRQYRVHTDCGTEVDPLLSAASKDTTWMFGDVNESDAADLDDLLLVLDAITGVFIGVTIQNADLGGCQVDGVMDVDDLVMILIAFANAPYPCPRVCLSGCDAPTVMAEGPRYLSVVPALWPEPVAILVTPNCLGAAPKYVGPPMPPFNIAHLVDTPAQAAYLLPEQWGNVVHVSGFDVGPSTTFTIVTDCGTPGDSIPSEAQTATTWDWTDVNNSGGPTDVDDLICLLNGFADDFVACSRYNIDLTSCEPEGIIDVDDLISLLGAFANDPAVCPGACP